MAAVAQVTRDAAAVGSPVGAVVVVGDSFRLGMSVLEADTVGAEPGCEASLDFDRLDRPVHAGGSADHVPSRIAKEAWEPPDPL